MKSVTRYCSTHEKGRRAAGLLEVGWKWL